MIVMSFMAGVVGCPACPDRRLLRLVEIQWPLPGVSEFLQLNQLLDGVWAQLSVSAEGPGVEDRGSVVQNLLHELLFVVTI